jgi:hypothetical protein
MPGDKQILSKITNMETVGNYEVISDTFSIVSTYVISA